VASDVKLPRLGQGMEAGTIVKWLKAVGDHVERGEPLYELDTDKVTQEVESEVAGVLLQIAVEAGEVPVGQTIAVIGEAGEVVAPAAQPPVPDSGSVEGARGNREVPTAEPAEREASRTEPAAPSPPENGDRIKASPLARRMARERGIELATLVGTGPDGRIVAEDVDRAALAAPAAPVPAFTAAVPAGEVESIPHTTIRKTIARRLTAAWEVPVFVLTVSVDMAPANALIEHSRKRNPDVRVTVTDLLAKVCAQALMRHSEVNVQFTDDAILRFPSANIGLAVAAPQGLVVPVIHSAERLSLVETARRRIEVVGRARDAQLRQEDLEGGTFTISNLGMYGVQQFVAILNPPQAAILAVGSTEDRAVVRKNKIVIRPMMTVSLTVDHRAVDGAPAAEFLQTVKTFLEEPALAL
jgi:pyruvate dehydrogenase E2 component (dihydrolipoamide acetyltransferase)